MVNSPEYGDVHFCSNDNSNERCAEQPIVLDIPAGAPKQGRSRCRKAGKIGHRGAGNKSHSAVLGEAKKIENPLPHNFFRLCRNGRHDPHAGVLIPRAGEPVRCQRSRKRAADYESKVAAASGCNCCR
jgi:hypothetical protein